MAVSLRVSEEAKKRTVKLAKQRDVTPHSFMLEAIREKPDLTP
jgi:predicted transcriptional regulator